MINVGSDFSGVGAFDVALKRLKIDYTTIFACDMDLYARETYMANHGEPNYYPLNVYDRKIPKKSLDIYMTSPPCQAFSLAGKRKGEDDKRGVLFYNSHEFIQKNKPRYFIFENVKGLMSDAKGRTFQIWLDMLGGKSVNGNPVIFPREDATPYHIYYKVLNAKNYGVPQNRERVFIIGIRNDVDNDFNWPKPFYLLKKLKDVLEDEVDEKFYLSERAIAYLNSDSKSQSANTLQEKDYCKTLMAGDYKCPPTIKVNNGTKKGYEIATQNDSINFSFIKSKTRRGRVGKEVSQTLDTACNIGVWTADYRNDEDLRIHNKQHSLCITTSEPIYTNKNKRLRKLTPRECFRLMDFPDDFILDKVSNTQAYKQAGNSIVVNVLCEIIKKFNLNNHKAQLRIL